MKEVHVVGAAIRDGNRILAAQRSMKMASPLKWEFAGGKVEAGETHEQALKREVKEELGIRIDFGQHLATGSSEVDDRKIVLHVYEAEILEGTPTAKEHAQLRWVEIDGLGGLEWAEADIPACKRLMDLYGGVCWNYGDK